jgi:NAD+ synthetase
MDSALCVALARPVCDQLGIKLIGVSLPIISNKHDEIERAIEVGTAFCHEFKEDDSLVSVYQELTTKLVDTGELTKNENIRRGNIKARLRMIYLYNLAFVNKGMVLSTDNYTEFLLGFWTKHGDEGDYGMIQYLFKTEVYEIGRYLVDNLDNTTEGLKFDSVNIVQKQKADAIQHCIDAVPTDGLGVSSSDLEQFGTKSYEETEDILKTWINWPGYENRNRTQFEKHPVVLQHEKTHFKRTGCVSIKREALGFV